MYCMKKSIILLSLFCLLLSACNTRNPAEGAVEKLVEAFHNNDIDGVKKYYVLYEGLDERIQSLMDENDGRLWDQVEIQNSVMRTTHDGIKDGECYVLANVTYRNGESTQGEFCVRKQENGDWKIVGDLERDSVRFHNDITTGDDHSSGKHPVLGNLLETYQELDVRNMDNRDVESALKDDIEDIIGNELPLGTNESQGVKISKATVHSVSSGRNKLSVLFELTPADPDAYRKYVNSHRTFGGGSSAFICYSFNSDEGVMKASVSSCYRDDQIVALLEIYHNRVNMWSRLKTINMIDYNTYEMLSRRH